MEKVVRPVRLKSRVPSRGWPIGVKCGSCVWPAGLTELLPELVLEGVPLVAACLDGTLVDANDEASRDLAVVGVEETNHIVVAATSRVEVVQVLSGHGEPNDEDDS